MKRTLCTGALIGLAALTAGCSFSVFQDIGTDPHPPTVEITALVHYVAPATTSTETTTTETTNTAGAVSPKPGRSVPWDAGGFTLSIGQQFYIKRSYTDAGGDIVNFTVRDRDGSLSVQIAPPDLTYFSGTSGVAPILGTGIDEGIVPSGELIELTGMFGRHRLELWAEDSHGSRSQKIEFVVTFTEF